MPAAGQACTPTPDPAPAAPTAAGLAGHVHSASRAAAGRAWVSVRPRGFTGLRGGGSRLWGGKTQAKEVPIIALRLAESVSLIEGSGTACAQRIPNSPQGNRAAPLDDRPPESRPPSLRGSPAAPRLTCASDRASGRRRAGRVKAPCRPAAPGAVAATSGNEGRKMASFPEVGDPDVSPGSPGVSQQPPPVHPACQRAVQSPPASGSRPGREASRSDSPLGGAPSSPPAGEPLWA